MAEFEDNTLKGDILKVIAPAYGLNAMLKGAHALLENFVGADPDGNVWAAKQIVEDAIAKAESIYMLSDELAVCEHADEIEVAYRAVSRAEGGAA